MVEFLPFLLILIGWEPSAPEETMAITHSLHATEDACRAFGDDLLRQKASIAGETVATGYRYFCIPAPTGQEYDEVFEQLK